jgi:hypothetical protein
MGRFGGSAVLSEFTPQVIQSLNQNAAYFINLGDECIWLATVLPAAAQGNWGPYLDTVTLYRQPIRLQIAYFNQMYQALGADPATRALMDNVLSFMASQVSPYLKQQIVVLAVTHVGR